MATTTKKKKGALLLPHFFCFFSSSRKGTMSIILRKNKRKWIKINRVSRILFDIIERPWWVCCCSIHCQLTHTDTVLCVYQIFCFMFSQHTKFDRIIKNSFPPNCGWPERARVPFRQFYWVPCLIRWLSSTLTAMCEWVRQKEAHNKNIQQESAVRCFFREIIVHTEGDDRVEHQTRNFASKVSRNATAFYEKKNGGQGVVASCGLSDRSQRSRTGAARHCVLDNLSATTSTGCPARPRLLCVCLTAVIIITPSVLLTISLPPPPAFLKTVVVQTFNFFVFRKKKNRKRNECGEEKEKDTPCQMSLAEMGSLSANEFCLCTLEIRESQYYYGQILNKHIPPKGQLCV